VDVASSKNPDREINAIAKFVKVRRKAGGLTQPELASLAGVGVRFVVELEAGKPTLRMTKVNAVLHVFGKVLGVVDDPERSRPMSVPG